MDEQTKKAYNKWMAMNTYGDWSDNNFRLSEYNYVNEVRREIRDRFNELNKIKPSKYVERDYYVHEDTYNPHEWSPSYLDASFYVTVHLPDRKIIMFYPSTYVYGEYRLKGNIDKDYMNMKDWKYFHGDMYFHENEFKENFKGYEKELSKMSEKDREELYKTIENLGFETRDLEYNFPYNPSNDNVKPEDVNKYLDKLDKVIEKNEQKEDEPEIKEEIVEQRKINPCPEGYIFVKTHYNERGTKIKSYCRKTTYNKNSMEIRRR